MYKTIPAILISIVLLALLCSCSQEQDVKPEETNKEVVSPSSEDLERLNILAETLYRANTCAALTRPAANADYYAQRKKAIVWTEDTFGENNREMFSGYEKKYDMFYNDDYKNTINCDIILQEFSRRIVHKNPIKSDDIDIIGKIISEEKDKVNFLIKQNKDRKNTHVAIAKTIQDISRQERTLAKGQYEKTDEFKKRIESTRAAIEQKIDFEYLIASSYDVDKELLTFTEGLSSLVWNYKFKNYPEDKAILFRMDSNSTDLGSYIGSNAFGVTKNVEKSRSESYEIVITNPELFRKYYNAKNKRYEEFKLCHIKCAPDEAKDIESRVKNGTIIAQISVTPKRFTNKKNNDIDVYVGSHYYSQSATLDDPREKSETDYYLHANMISFDIVDKESGKIYFQLVSNPKRPVTKK